MSDARESSHWKCPKCRKVSSKPASCVSPNFPVPGGLMTCSGCGHYISREALYDGKYDAIPPLLAAAAPFAFGLLGGIFGSIFSGQFWVGAIVGATVGGFFAILILMGVTPNSRYRHAFRADPFEQMPDENRVRLLVGYCASCIDSADFANAAKALSAAKAIRPDLHENTLEQLIMQNKSRPRSSPIGPSTSA